MSTRGNVRTKPGWDTYGNALDGRDIREALEGAEVAK